MFARDIFALTHLTTAVRTKKYVRCGYHLMIPEAMAPPVSLMTAIISLTIYSLIMRYANYTGWYNNANSCKSRKGTSHKGFFYLYEHFTMISKTVVEYPRGYNMATITLTVPHIPLTEDLDEVIQ
ncbi:hypothetical protein BCR42DRAFT_392920 [Absidia repens]|uniref:Uncharacterized protein n=1 Tax=Absidia repens TaxID=90262 RepID=A0A1X2IGG8_9FUNG|nr:hypothetical protein BCR42DRAFT_392920 [Absidia repens]